MPISNVLTTLEEYLKSHSDFSSGCASSEDILNSKKLFTKALNEYIDFRVGANVESHRREEFKRISSDINLEAEQIIASEDKELIWAVEAMTVINSAPMPPEDINDWIESGAYKTWIESYNQWYQIRSDTLQKLAAKLESKL
jgi:hypothetical protein